MGWYREFVLVGDFLGIRISRYIFGGSYILGFFLRGNGNNGYCILIVFRGWLMMILVVFAD